MSKDTINIEVNGQELEASPGQMLIEVTDAAGIYIPRFCYHEKLSIAANCRMCLVEVEKAPKPLPACATPVAPGMKVMTRSPLAISAQKATMEFLLINHPLDCPICDQGGECELQDLAMGYGRDISRYNERKRVVKDKDIGPLVSTDMTRCIHCTRCVRFGQEIAGIQELGTLGRGERTEIGTFIEKSIDHELSGNIIDLCPVGALNNKPYRFSARAWEMVQRDTIAPHDCLGANLHAHVLEGRVKRVVPKVNEAINETWASDRDRFSYEGIYSEDRLTRPMLRRDGELQPCSWDDALQAAAAALQQAGADSGALVSPSATVEEGYLLQRILRHLGSHNIDHRLRRQDFRAQENDPAFPWLGMEIAELEQQQAILVVGSNLRAEVPLLAHRVRKAALAGAKVSFINPQAYEYLFPVADNGAHEDLVASLGQLNGAGNDAPIVQALSDADQALILLGTLAGRDPRFAELRQQAQQLASATGAKLGFLSEGANSAGLSQAGVLPHRLPGGVAISHAGKTAAEMLAEPPGCLLLMGIEATLDCADAAAAEQMLAASGQVIALSSFLSPELEANADIVLPMGTFAETAGSYVNVAGHWQSFSGVANAVGDSRPGWKLLRVLGNLLDLPDCDYQAADAVTAEIRDLAASMNADDSVALATLSPAAGGAASELGIYQVDALVRRAASLQLTLAGSSAAPTDRSRQVA
jgi:NADH-quinone oxidoreductase subunit G